LRSKKKKERRELASAFPKLVSGRAFSKEKRKKGGEKGDTLPSLLPKSASRSPLSRSFRRGAAAKSATSPKRPPKGKGEGRSGNKLQTKDILTLLAKAPGTAEKRGKRGKRKKKGVGTEVRNLPGLIS